MKVRRTSILAISTRNELSQTQYIYTAGLCGKEGAFEWYLQTKKKQWVHKIEKKNSFEKADMIFRPQHSFVLDRSTYSFTVHFTEGSTFSLRTIKYISFFTKLLF